MIRVWKSLRLSPRFFYMFSGVVLLYVLSFVLPLLYIPAHVCLVACFVVVVADIFRLFANKEAVEAERETAKTFSLSDENTIRVKVKNLTGLRLDCELYDDIPAEFQLRDLSFRLELKAGETKKFTYKLRPTRRGELAFGNLNIVSRTNWGFVRRLDKIPAGCTVAVYPSVKQMREYELQAFSRVTTVEGLKKLRRIGHSYEFEQVKPYVQGDDFRNINWKATGRGGALMVNQYEDEKAQDIYCVIDKSRNMRMPFEGMSLLDYAINTSLAISNVALRKEDRAGLLTFSDSIGTVIKSDRKRTQLRSILNALYNEQERDLESNYELLYTVIRKFMPQRSLLMLFTNFESVTAMERVLPLLRKIGRLHLLVVVFFENTEVKAIAGDPATDLRGIYEKTVAKQFVQEKDRIAQVLANHGIQVIKTTPKDLSINALNKYLELKSRGMI
ncbi:hypothetical protein FUAX_28460 [Fulvitalea axinellae]|uniref:DUF58 domain-containing protein n=1 Tax=Fulvitalea axinellae TaxID=1182444 RepID=A0AAU9D7A7_9BACT|nr:hypothetical protein FUAX_28460 [Fulvitalea axinellae]